jgi:hypothetical protein
MKQLPRHSTWVILRDLPAGVTTDEQVSALLYKHNLPIPAANIDVGRLADGKPSVIVAITSDELRKIFARHLTDEDIAVIVPRKTLRPAQPQQKPLTPDFIGIEK